MEFRLIYQGPLPAERERKPPGTAKDKHQLRKYFHRQLRELWNQHPDLRKMANARCFRVDRDAGYEYVFVEGTVGTNVKRYIDMVADDHTQFGGRFVPLISKIGGFTCSLDILFLRRDNPGNLILHGGDIDNRIKVLLDGLRMPHKEAEMGGYTIDAADEDPFFCLLEDDSLITKISVTTDRLIVPQGTDEQIHNVLLVILVTMVNPSQIFAGGRLV